MKSDVGFEEILELLWVIEIVDIKDWWCFCFIVFFNDGLWCVFLIGFGEGDLNLVICELQGEVSYEFMVGFGLGSICFLEDG